MGFEFGSGDVGVAGFGGTSQTAFAAAVSHRHRPTLPLAGGAAMIIVATIATAWAGSTLPDLAAWPVALAAWALVPVTVVWLKARRKKWDADMAVWARSWVCRACGSVWDASAEKAA